MITRAELKNVRSLVLKKERRRQGRFLAEGIRVLEEAARFGRVPELVLYAESSLADRGRELVEQFREMGAPVTEVSAKQIAQTAEVVTAQGIVGVFALPEQSGELPDTGIRRVLMCEHVSDPGNLGTLLRSALAFGFGVVALAGDTADVFSPKVVRSSAGAIFGITPVTISMESFQRWRERTGAVVFGADISGGERAGTLRQTVTDQCVVLAIGSEPRGLSAELLELVDHRVRIAHSSEVESLNAAIAGSILMHEVYTWNT